jgi:hypothetical protein
MLRLNWGKWREKGTYLINTSIFPSPTLAISSATLGRESKSVISALTATALSPSSGFNCVAVSGLRTTAITKFWGSWVSCLTHSSCTWAN